ncbi:MAG: hypothetical protein HUJ76_05670, partial [Parasporobacterium sp.]|nr:hypothetical protein [Parasporobacterium sp.]
MNENNTDKKVNTKKRLRHLANFAGFVIILIIMINILTWILRGNDINTRQLIKGYKNVQGDIDVAFVGASNVSQFIMPLKAYNDYGFTSYDIAPTAALYDMLRYEVEFVKSTKAPHLYVISVNYVFEDIYEQVIRNFSDSLSLFSPIRFRTLNYVLGIRDIAGQEIFPYYFDLAKYHSNLYLLKSPEQYELLSWDYVHPYMGYFVYLDSEYEPFIRPERTDEAGTLTDFQRKILVDLLDYCRQEDLNVLFLNAVNISSLEAQKSFNAAAELIREYGYEVLNTNDYYDEIGLDFGTDFRDNNHLTCVGAEKYTAFISAYLHENYDLPDHRGEAGYSSWDEAYV